MSKHNFSKAERYAVWKIHGSECFWCGEPLELQHCTVDHVLPEILLDRPEELSRLITLFALPSEFSINGFENWVPAHSRCNSKKKETIYKKSQVMLSILERLQKLAPKVKEKHDIVVRSRNKSEILGRLEAMLEEEVVTKDELIELFGDTEQEVETIKVHADKIINRLDPRWTIVHADRNLGTATDGRLSGVTWIGKEEPDYSWRCPTCGSMGPWSGARCMNCGHFSDD